MAETTLSCRTQELLITTCLAPHSENIYDVDRDQIRKLICLVTVRIQQPLIAVLFVGNYWKVSSVCLLADGRVWRANAVRLKVM